MSNDTTAPLLNPAFHDEMTSLVRAHAQTAIRQAILAELETLYEPARRHRRSRSPQRGV